MPFCESYRSAAVQYRYATHTEGPRNAPETEEALETYPAHHQRNHGPF